jgi:polyferredoxin
MAKIGRPTRLIAYDTDNNIRARQHGRSTALRLVRPRTLLYVAVIALVGAIMSYALATRHTDGLNVIHDRNPLYVRLADGALRNGYAIRILNKTLEPQSYELKISGLPDADIEVIGSEGSSGGNPIIFVGPDQTREMRVLVTTHQKLAADASIPVTFTIVTATGVGAASAADHFIGP